MSVWFLGNNQWATPAAAIAVTACVSATSPAQDPSPEEWEAVDRSIEGKRRRGQ